MSDWRLMLENLAPYLLVSDSDKQSFRSSLYSCVPSRKVPATSTLDS